MGLRLLPAAQPAGHEPRELRGALGQRLVVDDGRAPVDRACSRHREFAGSQALRRELRVDPWPCTVQRGAQVEELRPMVVATGQQPPVHDGLRRIVGGQIVDEPEQRHLYRGRVVCHRDALVAGSLEAGKRALQTYRRPPASVAASAPATGLSAGYACAAGAGSAARSRRRRSWPMSIQANVRSCCRWPFRTWRSYRQMRITLSIKIWFMGPPMRQYRWAPSEQSRGRLAITIWRKCGGSVAAPVTCRGIPVAEGVTLAAASIGQSEGRLAAGGQPHCTLGAGLDPSASPANKSQSASARAS